MKKNMNKINYTESVISSTAKTMQVLTEWDEMQYFVEYTTSNGHVHLCTVYYTEGDAKKAFDSIKLDNPTAKDFKVVSDIAHRFHIVKRAKK